MSLLKKGQVIGGTYEIIEQIGVGGGGIVFRAKHLRLQTDVVIKRIKDEVRDKINLRQEADLLKNLKHPYLPRVYDFIEREDGVYTVMDFIKGTDLDSAMKKHGKFSQKEVKKWAEQLGEVLQYLHSQNPPIIHSDIKPANIMLMDNGDICLIDFNISLAAGVGEAAVGISAGYSPPEQYKDEMLYQRITQRYTMKKSVSMKKAVSEKIEEKTKIEEDLTELLYEENASSRQDDKTELLNENKDEEAREVLKENENTELLFSKEESIGINGKTKSHYTVFMGKGIDTRSDIYSLGVTLYYLLTGVEPPIDYEARIPITNVGIHISEGFALILEKMMELDPSDRYQNGTEFYKAIKNCHKLDHRYVVMRRKQICLQLSALGCLVIGIMLIFGGMFKLRRERDLAYYESVDNASECMQIQESLQMLEEAKQLNLMRITAYKEEVYIYYMWNDYSKCIETGEKYLNTFPFLVETQEDKEELGDIYYIVGNAYFEQDDYINSKKLFEYALEYNTQNGNYYRDYAIVLAKLGELEKAEEQLQKGKNAGITQDSELVVLGEVNHILGEHEEALTYMNQAIDLAESAELKKRAVLLMTDIYQSIGNSTIDQEISLLEKHNIEFEQKGNLVMVEYLADAYVRKAGVDKENKEKYYRKALDLFESISEKGYKTYQLQENIAILYQNLDCFEEAESILFLMKEEYPQKYEVYKRLAYLEADRQQMQENINRNYIKMREYYLIALEKYNEDLGDMEMDMLENMMRELEDGGWF